MNRSELAALISSTMAPPPPHFSAAVRASHPSSNSQSHLPVRNTPRQGAQTPVRRHGHTRQIYSEADARSVQNAESPRLQPGNRPLSRPSHARSYSYLPHVKTPQLVTPGAQNGKKTRRSMVAEVEEPDFAREEREAWSRKSPKIDVDVEDRPQPPSYGRATKFSYPNPGIVLQPPRESREPPPQPRKQTKQTLPLREFGPTAQESNVEERPKTSRGPKSHGGEDVSLRSSEDSVESASEKHKTRRSRFLEGSLNERSAAVASSWYVEHDSVSEDSYDSDWTPRVSRDTRESGSFDSNDSKALPIAPATVKIRKLFKLKSALKPSEDIGAAEHQTMPKKRGLRKSLSTWNFHYLGDKIKVFGGSTNDLTPKPTRSEKPALSNTPTKDGLDERKRKGEEAHVQQFGLKKQKSNNGIANTVHPSEFSVITKPLSMKLHRPSSSSRTPSSSHRSCVPLKTSMHSFTADCSPSEFDNSKRPSRKELEKENQHLRQMLRQNSNTQIDAHRSSLHLPLDDEENMPRLSQENFTQGHKMRLSPGRRMGRRGEDVPPVPRLSREVLGSLENDWSARVSADGKGMLPRHVSMIPEEGESREGDEIDQDAEGEELRMAPVKEQWEWPEDVF